MFLLLEVVDDCFNELAVPLPSSNTAQSAASRTIHFRRQTMLIAQSPTARRCCHSGRVPKRDRSDL